MTKIKKRLCYFEEWVDPIAERLLGESNDIDLVRLEYAAAVDLNWAAMSIAHGYQIAPRSQLREPWFGNSDLIARCANLLAIISAGAGFDTVDLSACSAAGVIVCNQSGSNREAVAEHALGMMLALSKKMPAASRALQLGRDIKPFAFRGNDIAGKTVGIVGIGQIGTRLAEICRTLFGMTVLAYDRHLSEEEVTARGAEKVQLPELLRRSDFVSVHCPKDRDTIDMFRRDQFMLMKPEAYFINTARGGIHNEADLVEALANGRIAGAGLDVFAEEPPPPHHPLLAFDNVIATPHIAGITAESLRGLAEGAAQQWLAIFAGAVPPRLVNLEAWPRYAQRFEALIGLRPVDPA